MEKLIERLAEFHPLSDKSKQQLISLMHYQKFDKNHRIADLGEVPTHFFVLTDGIVRSYATDEKGKEYTRSLYVPTVATGAFSALILNKPSKVIYECLSDCSFLVCDFRKYKEYASQNIELANLYNAVMERVFISMEKRIYDLSMLDGKQRYLKLRNHIPNIENLIPQYHIASYLNVTPVQLSRIRKDLFKN
jgi:CRP-like cAMP-binding protein